MFEQSIAERNECIKNMINTLLKREHNKKKTNVMFHEHGAWQSMGTGSASTMVGNEISTLGQGMHHAP